MAREKMRPQLRLIKGGKTLEGSGVKAFDTKTVDDKTILIANDISAVLQDDFEKMDFEMLANFLRITLQESRAVIHLNNDYLLNLESKFSEESLITNGESHSVEYLLFSKICSEAKKNGLSIGAIFIKMRQFGGINLNSSSTQHLIEAAKFLNRDRFVPSVLTYTFENDPYYYMTLCKTDDAIDARFSRMLRRFA